MNRACRRFVLQISERRDVLLVRLERRKNLAELEVGAGAAGRPFIHRRTMRRVAHDRAVRQIEEACPQFRHRGGLGESRVGRHHGIQKRQSQRHTGCFQHRSAGKMFLRDEHVDLLTIT